MGIEQKLNQERRMREQQMAAQSFAQAVASGQMLPRDRFGVELKPGTMVLYRPNIDMIFKVEEVKPVLDPRMGPGVVTIVLSIQAPITVRLGQPLVSMIVVGATPPDGAEAAPAADPPADPPGETPPFVPPDPAEGLRLVPPSDENPPSGD